MDYRFTTKANKKMKNIKSKIESPLMGTLTLKRDVIVKEHVLILMSMKIRRSSIHTLYRQLKSNKWIR